VSKELSNYKLDSMGVQEIRLDDGGAERAGVYIYFCRKCNENNEIDTGFLHKRLIAAVMRI
jgi:hypothetical protein